MKYIFFLFLLFQLQFASAQTLHHRDKDLPCVNKEFKIFVHLVADSLKQVVDIEELKEELTTVNQYFSPICMSFSLCQVDTVYDYNYNELKDSLDLEDLAAYYSKPKRINLYVLHEDGYLLDPISRGVCTGTVFDNKHANIYVKKLSTISHELGHFFGLYHTFEKKFGLELVDGSNCKVAGDLICDTPADPYVFGKNIKLYVVNCIFLNTETDVNGQLYQPDVGNIMSYYDPECKCGFTWEQYKKMAENYFKSN